MVIPKLWLWIISCRQQKSAYACHLLEFHFLFRAVKETHYLSGCVCYLLSRVQLFATRSSPGSFVHGFLRQEYWSGYSLLQGIFPTQGLNSSPALQADSLPSEPPGKALLYQKVP